MEESADPPAVVVVVVVETSSSMDATAVVTGTAGFETDRLPWKGAELRPGGGCCIIFDRERKKFRRS